MKKNSGSLFTLISAAKMESLTSVVVETLAIGFSQSKSKIFTTADLWNIQRQNKSRHQRRIFA